MLRSKCASLIEIESVIDGFYLNKRLPFRKEPLIDLSRLKFYHLFLAAAVVIVLINFAIGGFGIYFMVLMPAFPFCLLSILPISRKPLRGSGRHGIIGAGIGALMSVLPGMVLFAYDMVTGWKGGADIGLGLLYMFLPLYSVIFMAVGSLMGEVVTMIKHSDYKRWPHILRTTFLFACIGSCLYFLYKAHSEWHLFQYYQEHDPSSAELYEINFWLFIMVACVSLLIPIMVSFIASRKNQLGK